MPQFSVDPAGFKELRNAIVARMLIIVVILLVVVLILPGLMSGKLFPIADATWILLGLMTLTLSYSITKTIKRQRDAFLSYKLTITDETITREILGTPTITIPVNQIKEIIKSPSGALSIIGESKINAIVVLSQVENRHEVEQMLGSIKSITIQTSTPWQAKLMWPIVILFLGFMLITFYSTNKWLTTVTGVITIAGFIYFFYVIQVSKNIDRRTRLGSYWALVPLMVVIWAVISKWL